MSRDFILSYYKGLLDQFRYAERVQKKVERAVQVGNFTRYFQQECHCNESVTHSSVNLGNLTFPTPLPTALPTLRGMRNRTYTYEEHVFRRVDRALMDLSDAITKNLVPGEDHVDVSSDNVGMRHGTISPQLISYGDFRVQANVARGGVAKSKPDFSLPNGMFDKLALGDGSAIGNSDGVGMAATSWSSNPFEAQGGALQNGSSVTALSMSGVSVTGLDDPIVLTLPLPTSAVEMDVADPVTYTLNCTVGHPPVQAGITSQDIARAAQCAEPLPGYDDVIERDDGYVADVWKPGLEDDYLTVNWTRSFSNRTVYCETSDTYHLMQCTNYTGVIEFECPVVYSGADCLYWDANLGNWSSEGCEFWKVAYNESKAYCLCDHLTNFAAGEAEALADDAEGFVQLVASVQDLSVDDLLANLDIFSLLVGIWVLCGALVMRDKHARKLAIIDKIFSAYHNEHLNTILHEVKKRYGTDGTPPQMSTGDHFSAARAAKLAASLRLHREMDEKTLHTVNDELAGGLEEQRKPLRSWVGDMKENNDILAWFFPEGRSSQASSKRGVLLLGKIITLLFLLCLEAYLAYGPGGYMCNAIESTGDDDDDGEGDDDSISGGIVVFPDIDLSGGPMDILNELKFMAYFMLVESFFETIRNTVLIFPAIFCMRQDLLIGERLDQSDALHEERLMEQAHLAILRPDSLNHMRDAMVATQLLKTLSYILERQYKLIKNKNTSKHVKAKLSEEGGRELTEADLEDVRQDILLARRICHQASEGLKNRIAGLKTEWHEARAKDLKESLEAAKERGVGCFGRRRIRRQHNFDVKKQLKLMDIEADLACLPKRLHFSLDHHNRMKAAMDGRLPGGRQITILQPFIKRLKMKVYEDTFMQDLGALRMNMPRKNALRLKAIMTTFSTLYLLFLTLLIFMTAVTFEDNLVIWNIIVGVAVGDGYEILFTGPLEALIFVGILPAIGAWLMMTNVKGEMRHQVERHKRHKANREQHPHEAMHDNPLLMAGMLDVGDEDEEVKDDDLVAAFEGSELAPLAPGWMAIDDPVTGTEYYVNSNTGEKRWDRPEAPLDEEAAIGDGHENPPPPGWEMHESKEYPGTLFSCLRCWPPPHCHWFSPRFAHAALACLLECKQVTTFTKTHRPAR